MTSNKIFSAFLLLTICTITACNSSTSGNSSTTVSGTDLNNQNDPQENIVSRNRRVAKTMTDNNSNGVIEAEAHYSYDSVGRLESVKTTYFDDSSLPPESNIANIIIEYTTAYTYNDESLVTRLNTETIGVNDTQFFQTDFNYENGRILSTSSVLESTSVSGTWLCDINYVGDQIDNWICNEGSEYASVEYDASGLVSAITINDAKTSFEYNDSRSMIRVIANTWKTEAVYNSQQRLILLKTTDSSFNNTNKITRDSDGMIESSVLDLDDDGFFEATHTHIYEEGVCELGVIWTANAASYTLPFPDPSVGVDYPLGVFGPLDGCSF